MKTRYKILIALAVLPILPGYLYFKLLTSEVALFERFPDLDQDLIIKANRQMFRNSLKGQYEFVDTDNDEVMDGIFLDIYHSLEK